MWRKKKHPLGITMDEVIELVCFTRDPYGELQVQSIWTSVLGSIHGGVGGDSEGGVGGKINGREWKFLETPKEKAIRLIREGKGEEAIKVLEEQQ